MSTLLASLRRSPALAVGCLMGLTVVVLIVFRNELQAHDPGIGDLTQRFLPFGSPQHWLGTDNLGRDLWSRVLEGLPWSLGAALVAAPWFLRNWVLWGNPVYPYLFDGRYWDHWRSEWNHRIGSGIGWNLIDIERLPWTAALGTMDTSVREAGRPVRAA